MRSSYQQTESKKLMTPYQAFIFVVNIAKFNVHFTCFTGGAVRVMFFKIHPWAKFHLKEFMGE